MSSRSDLQNTDVVAGPAAGNYTPSGLLLRAASQTIQPPRISTKSADQQSSRPDSPNTAAKVFVAGSVAVDLACDYVPARHEQALELVSGTSNPARIAQSLGGVGHNVARAAQLAGADVQLCTAVGDDLAGRTVLDALSDEGLSTTLVESLTDARTAQYVAVNDARNELVLAVSDMTILEGRNNGELESDIEVIFDTVWRPEMQRSRPSVVVVDANWQPNILARWIQQSRAISATTVFEPVSNAKSERLFSMPDKLSVWPQAVVDIATPNAPELAAMHAAAKREGLFERDDWWQVIDSLAIPSSGIRKELALATSNQLVDQGIPQRCIQLLPVIPTIMAKLGPLGVLLAQIIPHGDARLQSDAAAPYIVSRNMQGDTQGAGGLYLRLFPASKGLKVDDIVSVNGVGDTFLGVAVAALATRGRGAKVEEIIDVAQRGASMTLRSKAAVSTDIGSLRAMVRKK